MRTSDVSSAPQCSQLSSSTPARKDETHVEVELLEERVDLVQSDRVDAHVERSGNRHGRAQHQEPDPEPEP